MLDKETILNTREKYLKFIAEWPERFNYKGQNFKELFTLNKDLSLWWLTEMQKKDPEGSPVFENLCWLAKGKEPSKGHRGFKSSLFWYFLLRVRFLLYMFQKILIFKLFFRGKNEKEAESVDVLFVSLYANTLKGNNRQLIDRYYLDLPVDVEKKLEIRTSYVSFYYKSAGQLLKEIKKLKEEKIIFYERYLNLGDLLTAFNFSSLLKYIFIESKKEFKESFNLEGKNVFDIFKDELRVSFVGPGISEWILLVKAIERIVRQHSIKAIISFLEIYPYSRALYYGAQKGFPGVKTIAYQHANITSTKLWYIYNSSEISLNGNYIKGMPVPDYFIFQGKMGKELLVKSGYPENRCFLTGSPRFDSLVKIKPGETKVNLPSNKKIILIATTYLEEDTRALIKTISEMAKKRNDCFFVFKAHPNCPVESILKEHNFKNFSIADENIHQLISKANILVTSYSTTADEAIALGCPSICVDTGVLVNMSTFFTIEAAPTVSSPDELNLALDRVFYQPEEFKRFKEKWPELIEASFYRLDGQAGERVLGVLERIIK